MNPAAGFTPKPGEAVPPGEEEAPKYTTVQEANAALIAETERMAVANPYGARRPAPAPVRTHEPARQGFDTEALGQYPTEQLAELLRDIQAELKTRPVYVGETVALKDPTHYGFDGTYTGEVTAVLPNHVVLGVDTPFVVPTSHVKRLW
jgi:hypothetical protein